MKKMENFITVFFIFFGYLFCKIIKMSIEIKGGNELRQFLNNPSCQDARKAANNWKDGLHNLSLHIGNQLALCKIIRENTILKDIVKEDENNDERDVYFIIFSL